MTDYKRVKINGQDKRPPEKMNRFWDEEVMVPLIRQYQALYDRTDKKNPKLVAPTALRDALWLQLHPVFEELASVVAMKMDLRTQEPKVNWSDDCVSQMHDVTVQNVDVTKDKLMAYYWQVARIFFVNYVSGAKLDAGPMIGTRRWRQKEHQFPPERWKRSADLFNWAREEFPDWIVSKVKKPTKKHPYWRLILKTTDAWITDWPDDLDPQQDTTGDWSLLADSIDWQAISEYIPDCKGSWYAKGIAHVFLDCLRIAIDEALAPKMHEKLVQTMVKARLDHNPHHAQIKLAREIVKEAYALWCEEEGGPTR